MLVKFTRTVESRLRRRGDHQQVIAKEYQGDTKGANGGAALDWGTFVARCAWDAFGHQEGVWLKVEGGNPAMIKGAC